MIWLAKIWQMKKYIFMIIQFLLPFLRKEKNKDLPQYGLKETVDVLRFIIELVLVLQSDDRGNPFAWRKVAVAAIGAVDNIALVPNELSFLTDSDLDQIKAALKKEYPDIKTDWILVIDKALKIAKALASVFSGVKT